MQGILSGKFRISVVGPGFQIVETVSDMIIGGLDERLDIPKRKTGIDGSPIEGVVPHLRHIIKNSRGDDVLAHKRAMIPWKKNIQEAAGSVRIEQVRRRAFLGKGVH